MQRRPTLSGSLSQVRPLDFGRQGVVLGCETEFDAGTLGDPGTTGYLEDLLEAHFGVRVPLTIRKVEKADTAAAVSAPRTLQEVRDHALDGRRAERMREARRNPAIRTLVDALGARVSKVRLVDD